MPNRSPVPLAFLPQHTPSKHRVMAVVCHERGAEIEALASFPDAATANTLAEVLNGVLTRQDTAHRRLATVLSQVPDPVRAAVQQLLPDMVAIAAEDTSVAQVARHLPCPLSNAYLLFPTSNCPDRCEMCGTCQDDCAQCETCSFGGCDTCVPVAVTPRTAAVLGVSLALLADEAYDHIGHTGVCNGGQPGPLGAVPRCLTGQNPWVLRRYARAFDDLAEDLDAGEMVADLEADLPSSRWDYDFDALQDVLFQDKDYEGLLDAPAARLTSAEAEGWFEEFGNIPPRRRWRGFRR